jgi:hypothetical protein
MRLVGGFQLVVGVAILGLWTVLLATGQVPEVEAGQADIWFHLAAEAVLATLLLVAGTAALRRSEVAPLLSGLAFGALVYSSVNSAGYYADRAEWAMVAMFAVIVLGSGGCVARAARDSLRRRGAPPTSPPDEDDADDTAAHHLSAVRR